MFYYPWLLRKAVVKEEEDIFANISEAPFNFNRTTVAGTLQLCGNIGAVIAVNVNKKFYVCRRANGNAVSEVLQR